MKHQSLDEIKNIQYHRELRWIKIAEDLRLINSEEANERRALAKANWLTTTPEEREAFHHDTRRIQIRHPS